MGLVMRIGPGGVAYWLFGCVSQIEQAVKFGTGPANVGAAERPGVIAFFNEMTVGGETVKWQ